MLTKDVRNIMHIPDTPMMGSTRQYSRFWGFYEVSLKLQVDAFKVEMPWAKATLARDGQRAPHALLPNQSQQKQNIGPIHLKSRTNASNRFS